MNPSDLVKSLVTELEFFREKVRNFESQFDSCEPFRKESVNSALEKGYEFILAIRKAAKPPSAPAP